MIKVSNNRIINAVRWSGQKLNSIEQRIILGSTALATQPFFDYYNKKVDEDTRKISAARTVAKIIAGTAVGIAVRALSIKGIRAFSNYDLKIVNGNIKRVLPKSPKDIFVPIFAKIRKGITPAEFKNEYENYIKTAGVILASIAMIATNFLCDAPATNLLTNKFTACMHLNNKEKGGQNETT